MPRRTLERIRQQKRKSFAFIGALQSLLRFFKPCKVAGEGRIPKFGSLLSEMLVKRPQASRCDNACYSRFPP